jgi:hypothetical protein
MIPQGAEGVALEHQGARLARVDRQQGLGRRRQGCCI